MSRWTTAALVALCLGSAAVVVGAGTLIGRDRSELLDEFAKARLQQLTDAALGIDDDLDDIGDDLRFAAELLETSELVEERARELRALLAVVGAYKVIDVYGPGGELRMSVSDPRERATLDPAVISRASADAAGRALVLAPGDLYTSQRLEGDADGWYRVFAMAFTDGRGRPAGAVVVLVDTGPIFGRLRFLSEAGPVLLLGAHGKPLPSSAPALIEQVELADRAAAPAGIASLVGRMRAGERGTARIPVAEAQRLGLGASEAVAAFAPIRVRGGAHWSVATLAPTSALRAHERAIVLRLGLAASAVVLGLLGFAGYVFVASRRAAVLRERLHSAGRMAHLHEKAEKILDNIPTGVAALSSDGRITAINRALRERLPQVELGAPLREAFPAAAPPVVDRLQVLVESATSAGRVASALGEHLELFGSAGQYSLHAVPLEPWSEEVRTLLVVEDLSQVGDLESQLLRAEKLATVGILAAGIAHEIGTPLGVVRGRAEYVLGKLGGEHPQAAGIRVIVEQIDRVSRTIRQLLDFSRNRAVAVRPVVVAPLARGVAELLRFEADRRKLQVVVSVPDDAPPVAADPDQLQQVLVNLVLNACDACREGGRVELRVSAEEPGDGRLGLEIVDDGCGIPAEDVHRVFDPFFTTKKRGQGTGLGLTMAAQIVRSHGGTIDLRSVPGQGTKVTLRWPLAGRPEEVRRAG